MKHPRQVSVLFLAVLAALAGIAGPATAQRESPVPVSGKDLKQALATHKGKVVLLNLWATWCGPCVEEFPDLVKLHEAYKDKGLVVVGVSMDEPEDRQKVADFAQTKKATFPIFTRKGKSIDDIANAIDRKWGGLIPTTYLYDRSGKQAGKPLSGLKSYEEFEEAIKPLLNATTP